MKNKKILSVIMLVITLLTLFVPLFSLNTSAAVVTDLTGTTWYVTSGWSASAGYGQFNIVGTVNGTNTNIIAIGYNDENTSSDSIVYIDPNIGIPLIISPTNDFTLTITGGTDATNTALISWLTTYGELEDGDESDEPGVEPVENFSLIFRLMTPINDSSLLQVKGNGFDYALRSSNPVPSSLVIEYSIDKPYYDEELDKYYYLVNITTNGYIPSVKFYRADGTYIQELYFDEESSEIITVQNGERLDFYIEYSDTLGQVITYSRRFYLYSYSTDEAWRQGYDFGYSQGFSAGHVDGYNEGYEFGYNLGYDDGASATASQNFGKNLLGSTLNAPLEALNNFVLIELGEVDITLGYIFGAVVGLCLLLAFLKMFAGG